MQLRHMNIIVVDRNGKTCREQTNNNNKRVTYEYTGNRVAPAAKWSVHRKSAKSISTQVRLIPAQSYRAYIIKDFSARASKHDQHLLMYSTVAVVFAEKYLPIGLDGSSCSF